MAFPTEAMTPRQALEWYEAHGIRAILARPKAKHPFCPHDPIASDQPLTEGQTVSYHWTDYRARPATPAELDAWTHLPHYDEMEVVGINSLNFWFTLDADNPTSMSILTRLQTEAPLIVTKMWRASKGDHAHWHFQSATLHAWMQTYRMPFTSQHRLVPNTPTASFEIKEHIITLPPARYRWDAGCNDAVMPVLDSQETYTIVSIIADTCIALDTSSGVQYRLPVVWNDATKALYTEWYVAHPMVRGAIWDELIQLACVWKQQQAAWDDVSAMTTSILMTTFGAAFLPAECQTTLQAMQRFFQRESPYATYVGAAKIWAASHEDLLTIVHHHTTIHDVSRSHTPIETFAFPAPRRNADGAAIINAGYYYDCVEAWLTTLITMRDEKTYEWFVIVGYKAFEINGDAVIMTLMRTAMGRNYLDKHANEVRKAITHAVTRPNVVKNLNTCCDYIPFEDGLFDLENRAWVETPRDASIVYTSWHPYPCPKTLITPDPTWQTILTMIPKVEDQVWVEAFAYYCLIPSNDRQVALALVGEKGCGKSTIMNVLCRMIEQHMEMPLSTLVEDRVVKAMLRGMYLCWSDEMGGIAFDRKLVDVFKMTVTAKFLGFRNLYQQATTFTNFCRFVFTCNNMPPQTELVDDAVRSRLKIIQCKAHGGEDIANIDEQVEIPALMGYLIHTYASSYTDIIAIRTDVEATSQAWNAVITPFEKFLQHDLLIDGNFTLEPSALLAFYQKHFEPNITYQALGRKMTAAGHTSSVITNADGSKRIYVGIGLGEHHTIEPPKTVATTPTTLPPSAVPIFDVAAETEILRQCLEKRSR